MNRHWPILTALILLFTAMALGLWQQQQKAGVAAHKAFQPSAPTVQVTAPATPQTTQASSQPQPPPLPAAPQAPKNPADLRGQILQDLKAGLQNKTGVQPASSPDGGFTFTADGARVEVRPQPNWSISIYNINPAAPTTETDGFKQCFEAVATALALDLSATPTVTDAGVTNLKTSSKLGNLSVQRDPANGNAYLIRPLGPRTLKPAQPAGTKVQTLEKAPAPPQPQPNEF